MTPAVEPIRDDELDGLFGDLAHGPFALAVSGGADSMALMRLIARWAARPSVKEKWSEWWAQAPESQCDHLPVLRPDYRGLQTPVWLRDIRTFADLARAGGPPQIVVLTVDHGLRTSSAREAEFVADEARGLGFPCQILRWEGGKPTTGIQEAARRARRELMLDVLRAEAGILSELSSAAGFRFSPRAADRVVVLAHHMEDQAETFLMRLGRGSGIEGLSGMRSRDYARSEPTPECPQSYTACLWRPLLGVPKARLVATLRQGGHGWVEDPTNEDDRFERVRVRKAFRHLSELGLTAGKIALSARRLCDSEQALQELAQRTGESHGDLVSELYAEKALTGPLFRSPYLRVRTLRHLIRLYGGAAREPELGQLETLEGLVSDDEARRACGGLTLGGCKIEFIGESSERVRVCREGAGDAISAMPIEPGQSLEWDGGRFSISAPAALQSRATVEALGMSRWAGLKRHIPELASLRLLPAAAVATLPVIVRDGVIVAHPALGNVIDRVAGRDPKILASWRAYAAGLEQGVIARFSPRAKW